MPLSRSAPLNLGVLLASLAILAVTLLVWPISWLLKRRYPNAADSSTPWSGRCNSPDRWLQKSRLCFLGSAARHER